ncbi:MAG: hypothetical protein OXC63_09765 [Aestuariivita sp.]|nr:hypothetical protein [Aestuariivita sp.]MCY4288866.1 hypothetical protein [Aestuariivita sp.]MCY4345220.1 hypothetical protein [Aestuariivita sp.]
MGGAVARPLESDVRPETIRRRAPLAATKEWATTGDSGCEPLKRTKKTALIETRPTDIRWRRHRRSSCLDVCQRNRDDQRADGLIVSVLTTRAERFRREPTVDKAGDVRSGSCYLFAGLTAVLIRAVTVPDVMSRQFNS